MTRRVLAFATVGSVGFGVQLGMLWLLTAVAGWGSAAATAAAVEAAVLVNFLWHERLTWGDRRLASATRFDRLCRFHLSNGLISIVGSVILTHMAASVLNVHLLAANALSVVVLGALNFLSADRWVFARRAAVALTASFALASTAYAADSKAEAIAAWNRHVTAVEAGLSGHEHDAPLSAPVGRAIDVAGGTIHEWRGSILVPGVTVPQLIDALMSPEVRPRQEDIAESRVLDRNGDSLRMYLKLVRRVVVTVTYDTEHDVRYVRRSPAVATSRSVATKIVEQGGADRGFLWRLNSYWRYRQVAEGVQVDVLSLSLSRDVPWVVKPVVQPLIERVGRESMSRTLLGVARTAGALRTQPAVMAARRSGR
jgi:putative flippase GtrA